MLGLLGLALINVPLGAQELTTPEKHFGFPMGTDRKMARWDDMVAYYQLLQKESNKIKVVDAGPSTMGNPFLFLFISSPANLARLDQLRQINAKLSDPRGITQAEAKQLVKDGKAVVIQSMSLHATEIGGSQMAPELVYDLLSRTDEEAQRILDNVVTIIVPSFNPDGQIMVTDWYRKTLGTEYEGVNYPSLYHKYTGHDNNRDAFMTNMVESQYMAKYLFREWIPQAYVDHHHMGSYGARIYVPPYAEPVRPSADPLVWRELSWYGAHIAYKEEEAGKSGIINDAIYSGWGHMGFHWITPFHNIAGMLTESASARLATPLFVHPDQLQGNTRNLPEYGEQTNFPDPWPGGWWHLRDIVERQKIAAWSILDLAARNRETVLWNAYLKAKRQTERGAAGTPKAFIVPAEQHDPLTAIKMVNKLLIQGVEVQQSAKGFTHDGAVYGPGTFVISMAQPKMGVVRWMLGRTFYPDNTWTHDKDGNPIRPYDMSADVMAEFMGVRVVATDKAVGAVEAVRAVGGGLLTVAAPITPVGKISKGPNGYLIDGRLNDAFKAVNLLFDKGVSVRRVDQSADGSAHPGDFIVPAGSDALVADVAKQTGVDFAGFRGDGSRGSHEVRRLRLGMYQRYYGGNMDEGWTRWLLEQWDFPYQTLFDADIKAGSLETKYDVIILPADNLAMMTGERGAGSGQGGGGFAPQADQFPPEYRSGFGAEGVAALKAFVEKGGTLLTFGEAGQLPIERFGLPLRNVVAGLSPKEFWCPGSTLRVTFDNTNPLAYGMPETGLATFLAGSQVYQILPTDRNERVETMATYLDRDILQSGWLLGEQVVASKAAMVSVQMGQGKVVLIGFRAQHRAQTHGTFKLVFNPLVSGPAVGAAATGSGDETPARR
jgi:hypothetical protein